MAEISRYHLAAEAAQLYERDIVPSLTRPQAELFLEQVAFKAGERVVDVACGTGIVTRVAVQRVPTLQRMLGIDVNPAMLHIARATTPATPVTIAWQVGDMRALPLRDHSVERVLCQHGLQFVSDKLTALREMRRILVPGGRLAFTVWEAANRPHAALAASLRQHVSEEAAASCLSPFAWHDATTIYHLVETAALHAITLQRLEGSLCMDATPAAVDEFVTFIAARSPFARAMQAAHAVLVQEVYAALQPYRHGEQFVMPTLTHLLQASVP